MTKNYVRYFDMLRTRLKEVFNNFSKKDSETRLWIKIFDQNSACITPSHTDNDTIYLKCKEALSPFTNITLQ